MKVKKAEGQHGDAEKKGVLALRPEKNILRQNQRALLPHSPHGWIFQEPSLEPGAHDPVGWLRDTMCSRVTSQFQ